MWRIRNLPAHIHKAHTHERTHDFRSQTLVLSRLFLPGVMRKHGTKRHEHDDEHDSGRHAATTGKTNATFSSPAHLNWN